MLSINFSTGIVGGAGAGVLAAVLASGVFIGMPELGGRNLAGNFSVGNGSPAGMGATISGVTITINSVFDLGLLHRLEELAENGNVSQERYLLEGFLLGVVQQAADDEALAVGQLHLGLHLARRNGRYFKTRYLHGIGEIQRADFRSHLQPDRSAGVIVGMKFRRTPYSLNLIVIDAPAPPEPP